MRITLELPEDIAQGLGSRWKDLPRAALESLALEAYRSHALTAAQLRRLLGFETRMQVDDFLKEHEVYDFTVGDFKQDCETLRQVRARELSIESALCVVRDEAKSNPVDRPSSADHWLVIGILPGKTANVGGRLVRLSLRFASPKHWFRTHWPKPL